MSRIAYTSNIPFDMSDWEIRNDIVKVAAGRNCAMAVLGDGTVLKKTCLNKDNSYQPDINSLSGRDRVLFNLDSDPKYIAQLSLSPESGWSNINQIAISQFVRRIAVGLREDGLVVVHVDREKDCDCGRAVIAYSRVKYWADITEVAVSDAIFALDKTGKVKHYSFYIPEEYYLVDGWQNVVHIVTGIQNSVFGVTHEGRVLCAGGNCSDTLRQTLYNQKDIIDVCTTGSESEHVILIHKDGKITTWDGTPLLEGSNPHRIIKLYGHFYHTVFGLTDNRTLLPLYSIFSQEDNDLIATWKDVRSFALGQKGFSAPFAIAVLDSVET